MFHSLTTLILITIVHGRYDYHLHFVHEKGNKAQRSLSSAQTHTTTRDRARITRAQMAHSSLCVPLAWVGPGPVTCPRVLLASPSTRLRLWNLRTSLLNLLKLSAAQPIPPTPQSTHLHPAKARTCLLSPLNVNFLRTGTGSCSTLHLQHTASCLTFRPCWKMGQNERTTSQWTTFVPNIRSAISSIV